MSRSFRIEESDPAPDLHLIVVEGELDLAVAPELREAIERAAGTGRVIVDLGPCDFIDSTGIAVLIRGREALVAAGGDLAICSPTRQVLRVLEVTGLAALKGFIVAPPTSAQAAEGAQGA
jgi:anti-sigma B factor antagonist